MRKPSADTPPPDDDDDEFSLGAHTLRVVDDGEDEEIVLVEEARLLDNPLPQRPYFSGSSRSAREIQLSQWARLRRTISLSGQISATSLVNSLSDSCKVYLIAYGGETAVAAVTAMAIVEWCPTILGATFQSVATLAAGISHLDEEHPAEAPRPAMLGPSTLSSTLHQELISPELADVGQIWRDGLKIAVVFSLPLEGLFWFSGDILTFLALPPNVVGLAQTYCRSNAIGIPAYLAGLVCAQLANAVGKSHVVFGIQVLSGVAGNSLGYLLGVRLFAPNMWGVGLGIATQYWISLGGMLLYFRLSSSRDPLMRSYQLFNFRGARNSYVKKILSMGWGVAFFYGFELGTLFTAIKWIGEKLGSSVLATQGVIQSWAFLLIVPAYAIGESANILVARYRALGRYADMRSFGHINAALGGVYGLTFLLLFELWPEGPIGLVIGYNNPQLLRDTVYVARYAAPAFLIDPIRIIYSGADRGLERTLMTVLSSVVGLGLIGLGSSYFLSFVIGLGLVGSAIGRNFGLIIPLFWMLISFEYGVAKETHTENRLTRFFDAPWFNRRATNAPLYPSARQRFFNSQPEVPEETTQLIVANNSNPDDDGEDEDIRLVEITSLPRDNAPQHDFDENLESEDGNPNTESSCTLQ